MMIINKYLIPLSRRHIVPKLQKSTKNTKNIFNDSYSIHFENLKDFPEFSRIFQNFPEFSRIFWGFLGFLGFSRGFWDFLGFSGVF